jgi:hypothetical protein
LQHFSFWKKKKKEKRKKKKEKHVCLALLNFAIHSLQAHHVAPNSTIHSKIIYHLQ